VSSKIRRYAPIALIIAIVSTAVVTLGWFVWNGMHAVTKPDRRVAQQVQIIRPPPPPEVKEEPPPEVKDEVKLPEPEQTPDTPDNQPPAGEQLGLDAEGGAGGDAFGLLGRKGGRDLLAGGGPDRFSWYANVLKSTLVERLSENRNIRRTRYSVIVRLWVKADGRVERVNLDSGTGDKELDRNIEAAFASLGRVPEAPPADLPQPVRLRLVNRI
jgi:protein TonB